MATNAIPFLEDDENSMDVDEELRSSLNAMTQQSPPDLYLYNYERSSSPSLLTVSHERVLSPLFVIETFDKEVQTEPGPKTCVCGHQPPRKRRRSDAEENEDDAKLCSICFDIWSNSGEHRLCSLRCGHLFGHSCLLRWLSGQKSCPSCKSAVRSSDIRFIYAKKLIALDTTELNRVRMELDQEKCAKNQLEIELAHHRERESLQQRALKRLQDEMEAIKSVARPPAGCQAVAPCSQRKLKIYRERSLEIHRDGSCRVLDYCKGARVIVASAPAPFQLFAGFGVRKLFASDFKSDAFIPLHTQAVRDVTFHGQQELLLSVSLDKTVKLTETANNKSVTTIQCKDAGWSCCWDSTNPNCFYVGGQMGTVTKYDMRMPKDTVRSFEVLGDRSPVVSLASPVWHPDTALYPSCVLACKLNSCWIFDEIDSTETTLHPMHITGPFISMRYDSASSHLLVSARPNATTSYSRHALYTFEKSTSVISRPVCNLVHMFRGSPVQNLLSRSCQLYVDGDVLVAAHQELQKTVEVWSASSGERISNLPTNNPVMDMCPIVTRDATFLCALNDKKLDFFKIE